MRRETSAAVIPYERIERAIKVVRGQRVILDADLAELYGVTTAALNQAVRRNAQRFPVDFAFQLNPSEFHDLISQTVTSKSGRGGRRKLPWAFTEHGVAMLSSVLRSGQAVRVNIEIMRAFVRLRRLLATPAPFVLVVIKVPLIAPCSRSHRHCVWWTRPCRGPPAGRLRRSEVFRVASWFAG
jgi:ORF6N domain